MKGYIDRFDSTIAGWVYDPAKPAHAVDIFVLHENQEVYRCKADLFRSDLVPVLGTGNHGFSFDPANIPGILPDMVLTIRAEGSESIVLIEEKWIYRNLVAEGSDGWLFLQNDSNNVNLRMAGLLENESDLINETAMIFATREIMLSKFGIPYRAIIVPEKNVVCQGYWPEMKVSDSRPVPKIIEKSKKFNCNIIYPLQDFLAKRDIYFLKTDTHLSINGYNHIISLLRKELPDLFTQVTDAPIRYNPEFCGNLGEKLVPSRLEATAEYAFPIEPEQYFLTNQIEPALGSGGTLRGGVIAVNNELAPKKKALLFGTSSTYHFLPAVSHHFSETLFIWENTFDYEVIRLYKPDIVLWLAAERFLPTACNDMFGLPNTLQHICSVLKLE